MCSCGKKYFPGKAENTTHQRGLLGHNTEHLNVILKIVPAQWKISEPDWASFGSGSSIKWLPGDLAQSFPSLGLPPVLQSREVECGEHGMCDGVLSPTRREGESTSPTLASEADTIARTVRRPRSGFQMPCSQLPCSWMGQAS